MGEIYNLPPRRKNRRVSPFIAAIVIVAVIAGIAVRVIDQRNANATAERSMTLGEWLDQIAQPPWQRSQ